MKLWYLKLDYKIIHLQRYFLCPFGKHHFTSRGGFAGNETVRWNEHYLACDWCYKEKTTRYKNPRFDPKLGGSGND